MSHRQAISAYTPSNTPPELLERIFVQRGRLLERIVDRLARSMTGGDKYHTLLIGPRGCGKTHIVSLTHHRLTQRPDLCDAMRIAWLGEDDTFTGLIDIALGIADRLAAEYPEEFGADYRSGVRGLPSDDAAESILNSIVSKLGDRHIVLLMENLDRIFSGLGEQGQKRWRAFLQNSPRIATLATSQKLFEEIAKRSDVFFGFFDIQHLKPLTVEDARDLIRKISVEQGKTELTDFLDSAEGRFRVRAICHLAGGNHRMYVLLAEFLTRESLDDLVEAFEHLAEELTPYFQERMRSLAPQQARLVQCLCNASGAMTVKQIAEDTFIAERSCSKQLGTLKANGYVRSQKRGKESFYEMAEPLMRLCLEVKNQRGRPLELIAKFLRAWYPEARLSEELERQTGGLSRGDEYRVKAIRVDRSFDKEITAACKNEIELHIKNQDFEKANELAQEFAYAEPVSGAEARADIAFKQGDFGEAINALSEVIDTVGLLPEKRTRALLIRGTTHVKQENFGQAVADFTTMLDALDVSAEQRIAALLGRAGSYGELGNVRLKLADYCAVIDMPEVSAKLRILVLLERGATYGLQGCVAQESLGHGLVADSADGPGQQRVNALSDDGASHAERENTEKALADFSAILDIPEATASHRAIALFNRGVAHGRLGDMEKRVCDYTTVIDMPGAPAEHRAQALLNRAFVHGRQGRAEQGLADYTAVIDAADTPADQRAKARLNRGVTFAEQGDFEREMTDYTAIIDAIDAPPEHRVRALLYRGITHGLQGNVERELADYTVVISTTGAPSWERAKAFIHRGHAHGQMGNLEQELADYTAIIEMPDAPDEERAIALINRALVHGDQGNIEQELADYGAVVSMSDAPHEQRARALFNRGVVFSKATQYESSLENFESALSLPGVSRALKTQIWFARPESMLGNAGRGATMSALDAAFQEGHADTPGYGGTPDDLLEMVLHLGHRDWGDYVSDIVSLYDKYDLTTKLAPGVVQSIKVLDSAGYSSTQLDLWNAAWQAAGKNRAPLDVPLRCLSAAIEVIKTKDDRALFRLPLEIREIVRPLLPLSLSEGP